MTHTDDLISQYQDNLKSMMQKQKTILEHFVVRRGEIQDELSTIKKFERSVSK